MGGGCAGEVRGEQHEKPAAFERLGGGRRRSLLQQQLSLCCFQENVTSVTPPNPMFQISWVEMAINSPFQNKEDGSRYCKSGNRRGWRANGGDKVHMYMIS